MYQPIGSTRFVALAYDDRRSVLRTTWTGSFTSAEYRAANAEIVAFAAQHPVRAIVSDVQQAGIAKRLDQEWVAATQLPALVAHGLRITAFVMAPNVFTNLSLKHFQGIVDTSGRIRSRLFADLAEAEAWVDEQLAALG